jgi:hypothetical protein
MLMSSRVLIPLASAGPDGARSTGGTGPSNGPKNTPIRACYGMVLHRENLKACTSPFCGVGGSVCGAPIEQGVCGTSSALVIERTLHVLAAWRARKPNYYHVKMARLKRENAVSDAQIGDIGTQEDNQTSDTWYGYLTAPPSPVHSGSGWRRSRNQCLISISIHDLFTGDIQHLFTHAPMEEGMRWVKTVGATTSVPGRG